MHQSRKAFEVHKTLKYSNKISKSDTGEGIYVSVENPDPKPVTPRWGVLNANVEGRWRRMRIKMAAFICIAITAMMVLPMSGVAGTMSLSAWTDKTSYSSPPVKIYVEWEVTDPGNFEHDYCEVYLYPRPVLGEAPFYFWGAYDAVYDISYGVVDVYCSGEYGDAQYDWCYVDASNEWTVDVTVIAYDYSQSPPDDEIEDSTSTNTFWL
jgi:hypothetical protein